MPTLHILSNERVRELARLTEVCPREIGNWHIHWTSPELSHSEADRIRQVVRRLLGTKELRPGSFAMEPDDVKAAVEGILEGRMEPLRESKPEFAPVPVPIWLARLGGGRSAAR